jgi:cell division initiation protein
VRSSKPDGMSLSPAELRHQRPKRTFIGYRVSEVDEIMTHATSAFETVWRDRADLEDRVHELETSLGELRDTEHAMRDALVTAQRTADELRAAAGRDAELIVREAEARAREIIHKTYAEREQVRREVERLRADERQFRTRLRTLLGSTLQTVRDHEEMIAEPAGELTAAGSRRSSGWAALAILGAGLSIPRQPRRDRHPYPIFAPRPIRLPPLGNRRALR